MIFEEHFLFEDFWQIWGPKGFPMGPRAGLLFDSGVVCFMGPYMVRGIDLA